MCEGRNQQGETQTSKPINIHRFGESYDAPNMNNSRFLC